MEKSQLDRDNPYQSPQSPGPFLLEQISDRQKSSREQFKSIGIVLGSSILFGVWTAYNGIRAHEGAWTEPQLRDMILGTLIGTGIGTTTGFFIELGRKVRALNKNVLRLENNLIALSQDAKTKNTTPQK